VDFATGRADPLALLEKWSNMFGSPQEGSDMQWKSLHCRRADRAPYSWRTPRAAQSPWREGEPQVVAGADIAWRLTRTGRFVLPWCL